MSPSGGTAVDVPPLRFLAAPRTSSAIRCAQASSTGSRASAVLRTPRAAPTVESARNARSLARSVHSVTSARRDTERGKPPSRTARATPVRFAGDRRIRVVVRTSDSPRHGRPLSIRRRRFAPASHARRVVPPWLHGANIVVIAIDTLSSDHVRLRLPPTTTPRIDSFATESLSSTRIAVLTLPLRLDLHRALALYHRRARSLPAVSRLTGRPRRWPRCSLRRYRGSFVSNNWVGSERHGARLPAVPLLLSRGRPKAPSRGCGQHTEAFFLFVTSSSHQPTSDPEDLASRRPTTRPIGTSYVATRTPRGRPRRQRSRPLRPTCAGPIASREVLTRSPSAVSPTIRSRRRVGSWRGADEPAGSATGFRSSTRLSTCRSSSDSRRAATTRGTSGADDGPLRHPARRRRQPVPANVQAVSLMPLVRGEPGSPNATTPFRVSLLRQGPRPEIAPHAPHKLLYAPTTAAPGCSISWPIPRSADLFLKEPKLVTTCPEILKIRPERRRYHLRGQRPGQRHGAARFSR